MIYEMDHIRTADMKSSEAMIHFIYHFIVDSFLTGGFIAQLVTKSHRYREVTRSNPVEVLNFFRLLYVIAKYCVHNCEDH